MLKGRNYLKVAIAIALIAEDITATIDTVKSMKQQSQDDKAAQAALAQRLLQAEKATEDLLRNLAIMPKSVAAAVSCRYSD